MDWRDVARSQAGVIHHRQLSAAGESEHVIDGLVRRRDLVERLPRVYAPRSHPAWLTQRLWAAALWSGRGVVSHRSAARLWSIPVMPASVVHVTVADRRFRDEVGWIKLHRVRLAQPESTSMAGLAVTTRARTVIDLLRTESRRAATDILDRARQSGWIGESEIRAALAAQPGRTGNVQLRALLAGLEPGAEAESERRLHAILRRARLTGWVAQHPIRLAHGVAIADVAFLEQRLVIEVDGRRYHDDSADRFHHDRRRQNELVALGWRVLRFTWRMLLDQPDYVLAQIVHLLAA